MKGFKIVNGDIALSGNGDVVMLTGSERIVQELSAWLLEPLGTDKLHARFGSILDTKIGELAVGDSVLSIKSEVVRVVNNYTTYQKRQLDEANANGTLVSKWGAGDIISSVNSVAVTANCDTVTVIITLTLASGETVNIEQTA